MILCWFCFSSHSSLDRVLHERLMFPLTQGGWSGLPDFAFGGLRVPAFASWARWTQGLGQCHPGNRLVSWFSVLQTEALLGPGGLAPVPSTGGRSSPGTAWALPHSRAPHAWASAHRAGGASVPWAPVGVCALRGLSTQPGESGWNWSLGLFAVSIHPAPPQVPLNCWHQIVPWRAACPRTCDRKT